MTVSITTFFIKCYYAEYHYAECCDLFIVMLNVVMLNVTMLSVFMQNVVMLSVVAPFILVLKTPYFDGEKGKCSKIFKEVTISLYFMLNLQQVF